MRRQLSESLRQLADGRISNDAFDQRWARTARRSQDPAVREIYAAAWHLYSDLETYRLVGTRRLGRETRRNVARCVLFLRTSRRYEWPVASVWQKLGWLPIHFLTIGISARLRRDRWRRGGEFSVWPFRRWSDYRAALRIPIYLHGRRHVAETG